MAITLVLILLGQLSSLVIVVNSQRHTGLATTCLWNPVSQIDSLGACDRQHSARACVCAYVCVRAYMCV